MSRYLPIMYESAFYMGRLCEITEREFPGAQRRSTSDASTQTEATSSGLSRPVQRVVPMARREARGVIPDDEVCHGARRKAPPPLGGTSQVGLHGVFMYICILLPSSVSESVVMQKFHVFITGHQLRGHFRQGRKARRRRRRWGRQTRQSVGRSVWPGSGEAIGGASAGLGFVPTVAILPIRTSGASVPTGCNQSLYYFQLFLPLLCTSISCVINLINS